MRKKRNVAKSSSIIGIVTNGPLNGSLIRREEVCSILFNVPVEQRNFKVSSFGLIILRLLGLE
ncbi:hypothetical protein CCACVL1_02396, partial [Corchorus capsularis]